MKMKRIIIYAKAKSKAKKKEVTTTTNNVITGNVFPKNKKEVVRTEANKAPKSDNPEPIRAIDMRDKDAYSYSKKRMLTVDEKAKLVTLQLDNDKADASAKASNEARQALLAKREKESIDNKVKLAEAQKINAAADAKAATERKLRAETKKSSDAATGKEPYKPKGKVKDAKMSAPKRTTEQKKASSKAQKNAAEKRKAINNR